MKPYYDNGNCQLYHADAREIPLPDQSVHCVVTSPPYFGLRVYTGLDARGIGLESSVEEYIANLVDVFREVRRVLRDDGVLWINLGDSMAGSPGNGRGGGEMFDGGLPHYSGSDKNELSAGNRLGIPERVVLALQDDGWIWRDTVIWAKKSAMPESVHGWTFTKHKIKIDEYERLLNLQTNVAGHDVPAGQDMSPLRTGEGKNVSSNAPIPDSEESLQQQHEGQNDRPQPLPGSPCIETAGEDTGRGIEETNPGEGSFAGSDSRTSVQTERISPHLSPDGEGESNEGQTQCPAVQLGDGYGPSSAIGGMARSPEREQVPMLLLQDESAAYHRPCGSTEQGRAAHEGECRPGLRELQLQEARQNGDAFIDCPGCPKCSANDGLVLRKGSWRCTSAHEYIFMLTKGMGYYCDAEAVKTKVAESSLQRVGQNNGHPNWETDRTRDNPQGSQTMDINQMVNPSGANRRSVWNDISPEPYGGSHFATFPSDLPRICIQVSTSERGCCSECGSQWARVVAHNNMEINRTDWGEQAGNRTASSGTVVNDAKTQTLGWRVTCDCDAPAIPATVLDPFAGTFTTGVAAQKLGRRAVGVDLSEAYLLQAVKRLERVTLPMALGGLKNTPEPVP